MAAPSQAPVALFTVLPYWFDGDNIPATVFSPIVGTASLPPLQLQSTATSSLARRPLTSTASRLLATATAAVVVVQGGGGTLDSTYLQPTATPIPGSEGTQVHTSATNSATNTARGNKTWPLTLAIMLLVSLGVYILLVSPILARAIASGRWRTRFYFLSSSSPSSPAMRIAYPLRSQPANRFLAYIRGCYNRSLLVSVPVLQLTLGQCLVLFVYASCVVIATFTQSGDVGKDAIRSGRIA